MGIFDWLKNYGIRRRDKIVGSLSPREIIGTQTYISAQKTMEDLSRVNTSLEESLRGYENKASRLEGSLLEAHSLVEILQGKNDGLVRELETERVGNETVARETAEGKDKEYSVRIKELEDEKLRLIEQAKLEALKLTGLEETCEAISKQNRYLVVAKQRAIVENVLTRLGRGESPEKFNCNEITGELARRYAVMLGELDDARDERDRLKKMLEGVSNSHYETLFDNLVSKGGYEGHFALLYIDNRRNISRISDNSRKFLGLNPESIKGKDYRELTRVMIGKDFRKKLILDWRDRAGEFREISLENGNKVDILLQRVDDYEGSPVGAFVFIANHQMFRHHRHHKRFFQTIKDVGKNLVDIGIVYRSFESA